MFSPLAYRKGEEADKYEEEAVNKNKNSPFVLFMIPCVLFYTHRPKDSAYLWTWNKTLKSKGYEIFI